MDETGTVTETQAAELTVTEGTAHTEDTLPEEKMILLSCRRLPITLRTAIMRKRGMYGIHLICAEHGIRAWGAHTAGLMQQGETGV